MKRVGVLALQGDVQEHEATLQRLGVVVERVKTPEQLSRVDALVLPGGESTAIAHLLRTSGVGLPLASKIAEGMPIFGTCAGLILLSSEILDGREDQFSFKALPVSVRRNGYGRQIASFEVDLPVVNAGVVHAVFIRAPKIESVSGPLEVLASLDRGDGEHPVLVRSGAVWGCSFHPELTDDLSVHDAFVQSL